MADDRGGVAGDHPVEPDVNCYQLGRDVIPQRQMQRVRMAVAIGMVQRDLIRRKRMSPYELRDYAWSVMEDEPDASGRVLRVIATPLRPPNGRRRPRHL